MTSGSPSFFFGFTGGGPQPLPRYLFLLSTQAVSSVVLEADAAFVFCAESKHFNIFILRDRVPRLT